MSVSRRDFLKSNIAAVTATTVGIQVSGTANASEAEATRLPFVADSVALCEQVVVQRHRCVRRFGPGRGAFRRIDGIARGFGAPRR